MNVYNYFVHFEVQINIPVYEDVRFMYHHAVYMIACFHEPRHDKTLSSGFPHRFEINRAVQPQKMARCLKFWI